MQKKSNKERRSKSFVAEIRLSTLNHPWKIVFSKRFRSCWRRGRIRWQLSVKNNGRERERVRL